MLDDLSVLTRVPTVWNICRNNHLNRATDPPTRISSFVQWWDIKTNKTIQTLLIWLNDLEIPGSGVRWWGTLPKKRRKCIQVNPIKASRITDSHTNSLLCPKKEKTNWAKHPKYEYPHPSPQPCRYKGTAAQSCREIKRETWRRWNLFSFRKL